MHWLISFVQLIASPLMPVMETLISALAASEHRSVSASDSTVAAFAVSTGLIGLFCILSTCWIHARLRKFRHRAKLDIAAGNAALYFREALLESAAQGVVILRNGDQEREYYGEGKALYEACMANPQSGKVIRAIDSLAEEGTPFTLSLDADEGSLALRGVPVAGRAVLYLQKQSAAASVERCREILEAVPFPVWLRDAKNSIAWANKPFLSMLGFATIEEAIAADAVLDWSERDLSAKALLSRKPVDARTSVIVHGETRIFSLGLVPISAAAVAGFATEITQGARIEAKLQLACDAQEDMVEKLPLAVAVFDRDQKLTACNQAYADLWTLPRPWLDSGPSYGEILERLRDERKLPEQRNFSEWKQSHTQSVAIADRAWQETWHIPNGKSVRITAQPHLQGGVFLKFDDITEQLRLESSLCLLTQVQKATLDTLDGGIAIFGTDGRLVLHNALFASMWHLSENELVAQPHFAEIANLCTARIGRDGIWGVVSCAVNSATPESLGEWGKTRRADGRVISLSLSRLPNGATVVTFTDLTDLERFEALENGKPHAAA
ncbi:MAG TPA: PAS-domain containing protein [Rhizomicrobium sp.]|nr:PAS-domain containing protein [Rhizomicrobium sp.]